MRQKNLGFTIVELIIVIVLVGILGAVAISRFINTSSRAKLAALQGLGTAISSAAQLAQTQWVVNGNAPGGAASISMNGQTITVDSSSGYPTPDAAGIVLAAQISGYAAPTTATAGATKTITWTSGNCTLSYSTTSGTGSTYGTYAVVAPASNATC